MTHKMQVSVAKVRNEPHNSEMEVVRQPSPLAHFNNRPVEISDLAHYNQDPSFI